MKMRVKPGKAVLVLEVLCLALLIAGVVLLAVFWDRIPDEIPAHYGFSGQSDRMGPKGELLVLAGFAWFIYIVITVIECFPKAWNTGVTVVTEKNIKQVYSTLYSLISSEKLIIVLIFVYLTAVAALSMESVPVWFTLAALVIAVGNLVFWFRRLAIIAKESRKKSKKRKK